MFNNIKRNKLDFMLTDMQPVEISEYFTLRYFYEYLDEKKFMQTINKDMLKSKKENKNCLFRNSWNSTPLTFDIYKRNKTMRIMSLPNPLADIMACQFIELYEKEILSLLETNNIYSLRFHKNNNKLYYKNASKRIVTYFSKIINKLQKRTIEQTGSYFSIEKYKSINEFTNSKKWYSLCLKYKKILKIDYKDCFRSIYSHVFNWFKFPNINDSKNAKGNTSLYTTIDNIIQRMNSSATNGIIVGPEFSRMLAEIFLQNIDMKVYQELKIKNLVLNKDYFIGRYVDDVFIFANNDEILEYILNTYKHISEKFMLSINENKISLENLPIQMNTWFDSTSLISNDISEMFYTDGDKDFDYYYKNKSFTSNDKQKVNNLLSNCKLEDRDTVVAYILSTFVNKLKPQKKKSIFPNEISKSKLLNLFDYVFYVYSFSISFNNTQRLISIISYVAEDINNKSMITNILKIIIRNYENIFQYNLYDIINLFPILIDYKIELSKETEFYIEETMKKLDDPILFGNLLLYSQYNTNYSNQVNKMISNNLNKKINYLDNKCQSAFMYKECWWLFIFINCPYLDPKIKKNMRGLIQKIINSITSNNSTINNPSEKAKLVILEFLLNSNKGFLCWTYKTSTIASQITFRTYQKTIFRQNRKKYKLFDFASF